MCSRVHQSADPFVVRNLNEKPDALPSQELLVFRKSPTCEIVDGYLRWGLILHYACTRPEIQPANARAESIAEKPMFKEAYRKRRCIDGRVLRKEKRSAVQIFHEGPATVRSGRNLGELAEPFWRLGADILHHYR
jgi:hypothetical protein